MARLRQPKDTAPPPAKAKVANLNEVIAFNFRAARELRGWTQEEVAKRLEPLLGQRLPQASISGIERTYEGERQRELDARAVDLGLLDRRRLDRTSVQVDQLYALLLGAPPKLEPVYDRLRQLGIDDPDEAELAMEQIIGAPAESRQWSYRERRNEMLLALVDKEADRLDKAADEFGAFFDHLRRVGIRGFVAENVHPDPIADEITTAPEHRRPAN